MEEPFRTVIAGMIGGALMGMLFVTHLALLLVYNPPRALQERAAESTVSNLITLMALVAFLGWNVFAIAMAFGSQALFPRELPSLSPAPAPVYLFIVAFVTAALSIPAFIFFRDRKKHLAIQIGVFVVIFGFLIPNLVIAIQRAQI